ncbi:hypothetical protein Pst134EB_033067 [Puccinia striiformis f. sp. tritici]|nr:hypothetical protein Pst134EB_033067 [Puccinia striiformis f. sp. tritici]
MLKRALDLKLVCITYCSTQAETAKYSLTRSEWDQVAQIANFLEPLYVVTKMLCPSKTPTLSMALPIYISLIRSIYSVRSNDTASQLIPAADRMIEKLKKYLTLAFQKTAPMCAMILDPRIKPRYIEKSHPFLVEHDIATIPPSHILLTFKNEAITFDRSPSKMGERQGSKSNKPIKKLSSIESEIFGEGAVANDLDTEIEQYLSEPNEKHNCNILYYWSQNRKIYPSLAAMAKCYLGIPATSAASERVFSRSKTIIGSQRHSLSPASIERLLCVKEWYQSFKQMMDTSPVTLLGAPSDDESDNDDSDEDED